MRDPELLLGLLREMANSPNGEIKSPLWAISHERISSEDRQDNSLPDLVSPRPDTEQNRRCHHMMLLAEVHLVEWDHRWSSPRITNAGYDLVEAVDKNQKCMDEFLEKMKAGTPLLQAVKATLKLLDPN